ncbi:MAG: rhodanese-like domain-containing protein [Myxococcota bacterium]
MARLMSSTELKERMDEAEEFVLVDVSDPEDYAKEHIPDAKNIPLGELGELAKKELNKNERIVVYGQNHDDESSNDASELLENLGYRKVADFDGGVYAWKRAGFLTEGTEAEVIG